MPKPLCAAWTIAAGVDVAIQVGIGFCSGLGAQREIIAPGNARRRR